MAERAPIRVLLIDDDDDDALLTRALLAEASGGPYRVEHVLTASAGEARLEAGELDVCLLDYQLGEVGGLDVLRRVRTGGVDTPILMLTGAAAHEVDVAASEAGADDYLVKGRIDAQLLERAIRYAIARRAIEHEVRKRNAELDALNREKNTLLGMAAHDLRNPIGVVLGYATFVRDEIDTLPRKDVLDMLGSIQRSSEHMLRLIDELLDLSSIDAGTLVLHTKRRPLGPIVRQCVADLGPIAAQKSIGLDVVIDGDPPVAVDDERFLQVATNLVGNAIKYSERGKRVRVLVAGSEAGVRLTVQDEGVGIAPGTLARLFEPFRPGRRTGTAGEKSTGLGLAIVQRIVEAHAGRISVTSELGRGSVFQVSLPPTQPTEAGASSPAQ